MAVEKVIKYDYKEFDFNGTYAYTKMLEDQIVGRNNSWAVRWYASTFLKHFKRLLFVIFGLFLDFNNFRYYIIIF